MIAKKYARRTAAALVVPALLMTAACGGSDDSGKNEVSGKPGDKPKVTLAKGAKPPQKVTTKTLEQGKGKAAEKGDFVRFDVLGKMTGDKEGKGQDLISTWNAKNGTAKNGAHTQMVTKLGAQQQMLPAQVTNAMVGKKAGSRVQVEGTAKQLLGAQQAAQTGMKPNSGMIWVLDVAATSKVDAKAAAKGSQDEVKSGLPQVKAEDGKPADITVPKGQKPPKALEQQTLIKGKGPEVKDGEGLVAQYTGVKWEDGKMFDSSWKHGGATGFQIGTKSVIPGWDKALSGKHIGDRVLLVAPPKEAYGASQAQAQQQQNPLAKNTLVFVVDIVGKV